jgi:hypothetical protein
MDEITFQYKFISSKGKEYEIIPMTSETIDDACKLLVDTCQQHDPLERHIPSTQEEYADYILAIATRSMDDKLAVLVRECSNSKIIGTGIQHDLYSLITKPLEFGGNFDGTNDPQIEFVSALGTKEKFKPTKAYQVIICAQVAVHADYQNERIGKEISSFVMDKHPMNKLSEFNVCECVNPFSERMMLNLGWKLEARVMFTEYQDNKGNFPFADINDTLSKMGIPAFDGITLMSYKKATPAECVVQNSTP